MPRVKRGTVRRAKRKKLLTLAKGYYANKSKLYRAAKESVDTALKYAFVGRRRKKRDFRKLWIVRLNAAAREHGLTYARLIAGLKAAGVTLDRKMLADMAVNEPASFAAIAKQAREAKALPTPRPVRAQKAVRPAKTPRSTSPPLQPHNSQGQGGKGRGVRITRARVTFAPHPSPLAPSFPMTDADIARARAEFLEDLARLKSEQDLQALRDKYLGRKGGVLTALMKSVAAAPADLKPLLGKLANELKQEIEQQLSDRRAALNATKAPVGAVDITLPGRKPLIGHRHPLTIVREQIEAIFTRMGYQVLEGPEVEDDYHNFEALNMPAEHPARDMQDTLYLDGEVPGEGRPATLLRTHTSPMQIRYMESHEPPVRIIVPGKVYRRDDLDLTHTPMFQQVEGLVVGERITLADLKGTLTTFLGELFETGHQGALPSQLFSVHRAQRGGLYRLRLLQRRRLPHLQAHGVARDSGQRDGASVGVRSRRLRRRAVHRVCVRRRHRTRGAAQVRCGRHPPVLRERPALPGAVRVMTRRVQR
jgi:phenylalanyl-tRNA synthetase alpha chain